MTGAAFPVKEDGLDIKPTVTLMREQDKKNAAYWKRWYLAVLLFLVVQILFYRWLTIFFHHL